MTPREIIARAWAITTRETTLRRWGFISSLFETLRNVELLLYQAYYLYWFYQGVQVGWLDVEILFFEKLPFWLAIGITVFVVILFVLELFIPTLANGAIIGLAAKSHREEKVEGGMILALYNFFPILEIHGFFLLSNIAVNFTVFSVLLRYGGEGMLLATLPMLIFLSVVSFVFHFFASFAEEAVVIRKAGIFQAIGQSFKLILSHVSHVVFLGILMIVISIRIVVNAVMILLFPLVVIGIGLLLALFLPPAVGYGIAAGIGVILLVVLTYFFAYLHIFKQTVWTITYMELSNKKELDVIDC